MTVEYMELTSSNLSEFLDKFYNGDYPNQRLGQAFCNVFKITNSSIFYNKIDSKTERLIHDYVMMIWK